MRRNEHHETNHQDRGRGRSRCRHDNAAAEQAADGNVYAYEHSNFQGPWCAWSGNDGDWSTCSPAGDMLNRASSLWNNGYPGGNDDVNFYSETWYRGDSDCLGAGDAWSNLANQWFTWGPGPAGSRQSLDDNIESHKWVSHCGLL